MADRLPKDLLELITSYMPMFDIVIMSQMNNSFRKRITGNINIKKHIKNEINYMISPFRVRINILSHDRSYALIHQSVNSIIDNDDKIDISKFKYDGDNSILYDGYKIIIQINGLYSFNIASNIAYNIKPNSGASCKIKLSNNRHSGYIYLLKIIDFKINLSDIIRAPIISVHNFVTIFDPVDYNGVYQLVKSRDRFSILISPQIYNYQNQNRKLLSYVTMKLKVHLIPATFDDTI